MGLPGRGGTHLPNRQQAAGAWPAPQGL